jgi:hypothetical protein
MYSKMALRDRKNMPRMKSGIAQRRTPLGCFLQFQIGSRVSLMLDRVTMGVLEFYQVRPVITILCIAEPIDHRGVNPGDHIVMLAVCNLFVVQCVHEATQSKENE